MAGRPTCASFALCWSCALRQQRSVISSGRFTRTNRIHSSSKVTPRPSSTRWHAAVSTTPRTSAATQCELRRGQNHTSNHGFHSTTRHEAELVTHSSPPDLRHFEGVLPGSDSADPLIRSTKFRSRKRSKIRRELRLWNEEYGQQMPDDLIDMNADADESETTNSYSRLGDGEKLGRSEDAAESERDSLMNISQNRLDELEELDPQHRFLRMGDLVELPYTQSERDSIIAVFVRRIGVGGQQSQFFTMNGRWLHVPERTVQYVIPGYIGADMVEPILPHLPSQELTEELHEKAAFYDLSVPREYAAPLVSKLIAFHNESEALYRKCASRLDNAHTLLAHPTDLKFGELGQVARRLLASHAEADMEGNLPLTALFTVRRALSRAGFAFSFDVRSHRLTGFLQIRSQEQVAMVDRVRGWLRDWQDAQAEASSSKNRKPRYTPGAQHVVDFLEKARRLIAHSRTLRELPSEIDAIGISKTRFKITPQHDATVFSYQEGFTDEDRVLIKFMEAWACSNTFFALPRLQSLPPLILQATGMYGERHLLAQVGFLFLQEIGVILPYENRVRFDQHLLLPSSQHSRPLEQLMSKITFMQDDHGFEDSMKGLRHDWKDLAVFCIDSEGAQEIDDGISLEECGNGEYWLHTHIANPTAFFDATSPLARMARHMTESIYMPERAFVMLPRWATRRHFGLASGRPCLTFSAKINDSGEYLSHKITPARVHNVRFMSPKDVQKIVGVDREGTGISEVTYRVGGKPPSTVTAAANKEHKGLQASEKEALKKLQRLCEKLQQRRMDAGGVQMLGNMEPKISIWNKINRPGLGWDPPSRVQARFVQGDPVVEYQNQELSIMTMGGKASGTNLVQEAMLLACEIAARWCAERNIPVVYRGSINRPDDVSQESFYKSVIAPTLEKTGGDLPLHLGYDYLRTVGTTTLTTEPLLHRVLGMSHYTKVTSPLRRYGDMITHWQIEAALRDEATNGSLIGAKDLSFLPFTESHIKQYMPGLQPRETLIRKAMKYAEDFWACQVLYRAHTFGECELPETFQAYVFGQTAAARNVMPVMIKENSINAMMLQPGLFELGDAKSGDLWEVKIDKIEPFYRNIVMRPLRLVSRWDAEQGYAGS